MFHGVARPGEIFEANWDDVYFPRAIEPWDVSQRDLGILRIKNPKTRWRSARQQFLLLDDPTVVSYLKHRKSYSPKGTKIWPFSPAVWNTRFQILLTTLGFLEVHYTAACCRAGGTTFDYLCHFSVPRLRLKGKWASDKSLDHYVQEATVLMASVTYSDESLRRGRPLSFFSGAVLQYFSSSSSLFSPPRPLPIPFPFRSSLRSRLRTAAETGGEKREKKKRRSIGEQHLRRKIILI